MLVKVLTMRFDPRIEGFDDAAIREFCRDKEALSVRDHFFVKDDVPYWAVMLTYNLPVRDAEAVAKGSPASTGQPGKTDYRALLREQDWPLFNALRDWRSERCRAEGVPPYIVLTNDVLAQVARERPGTLAALGQIRGLGEAKVKRYGREVLRVLGVAPPPPVAPQPPTPAPTAAADPAVEPDTPVLAAQADAAASPVGGADAGE